MKAKFNLPPKVAEPDPLLVNGVPEQKHDIVWFPKSWNWAQIFLWLKRANRDVDWWGASSDGRPECHLKKIG